MATEGKTSGVDMQDTLFGAMYEIARGVIAQQEYDITKECQIIEVYLDSKGERTGVYKVKHQNATYDAYAQQGDIYSLDQWVYVQIPNGDYNNNKFIVGQKVNKNDASDVYNLRLPFDNFLGLYNLTMGTPMEEHGYWANNPTQGVSENLIAEADENGLYYPQHGDHLWHWQNIDGTAMYATQLGLEVDVTTLLHGFSLASGNYGIRAVVKGLGYDEEAKDQIKDLVKEFYFDTASMYGNPYAYTMGTTQQCVLDIKNFLRVDAIDLWFWQDHNFKDQVGTAVPYTTIDVSALEAKLAADVEEVNANNDLTASEKKKQISDLYLAFSAKISDTAERPNISFTNLRVLLGLALDQLSEETAYLYTYDKLKYGADGTAESGEVKADDRTLNLAWVHKYNNTAELIDTYGALEAANAQVYWYYYDPTWTTENALYDYDNYRHRFGGMYWRPFDVDESQVFLDNDPLTFVVSPDVQKNVSKYKAVIHYDSTYVTSNIITFANVEAVETNNANLARNDKVILRIAQIRKVKDDGSTVLETDDTLGNFFVYDENNSVLTNSDNIRFSDVKYFVEPWIKVSEYDPENPEDTDNKYGYQRLVDYRDPDTGRTLNFTINWQFPDSMRYTMIKGWGTLDNSYRSESHWNSRSEEQFARDCEATRYFQISPLLDAQYGNNDIAAVIDIAGMGTFNVKKELLFGQACSFGCEYTPVITISAPAGNSYVDTNTDFEMYCVVYDRQGKLLDENLRSACEFEWKYYGTRYKPADTRPHENYMGFVGNVIKGRITQPYPFVIEVTVKGAAAYDITVRRGIMVGNNSEFMQTHDIMCPNRVEFRSDGQAPIYQSNAFEVAVIKEDGTENELIYPEWKINQERVLTLVESVSTYPDLVSPTGGYFTKPEDNTCYALAFSAHTLNGNAANPNAYAQQWTDDLLTDDLFTYIEFTYGTATVAQAIAFAQNLYPSSLVNEWDGQSLSLDEENSAIIAKMIAAGTKDQKNRFTGVMMGDWSEKGDSSLDVPGLYGFNAGAQSFGFKTDGTGFIGPAGEGRIQFDGRNALISNSSKTCYINLNPRRVNQFISQEDGTLDNQAWDSVGNQSYSQYFLYSKAPRRINSFGSAEGQEDSTVWINNWDQHTDFLWTKDFMEDVQHDYFLVDPNYGVATTGGIFARYGHLGHEYPWVISDYGLTQKNIFGRIFLGNPEKNLSIGQNIPTPKFTNEINSEIDNSEIEVPANFFSASFANAKNIIQTGIRADGYLYTKYAAIGGWYVNDGEIYSVDSKTYENNDSSKGFRKAHSNDGYKKDLLNINSKDQFIAFNNGRFVINGKHGWMGFYNDNDGNTIALTATPSAYNMWIDFKNGTVNFGKDSTENSIPHVVINGKNGNAYFAKGNIVIDGENATIFCGVPTNPQNMDITNTTGTIQLANIVINALTAGLENYPLDNVYQITNTYSSSTRENEDTGESDEDIEEFSTIWGSGESGFIPTLDSSYVSGKQYYKSASSSDKFTPAFGATITITPNIASVTNQTQLLTQLGIYPLSRTGTTTLVLLRQIVYSNIEESGEIGSSLSSWQHNGVNIQLSNYGLTLLDANDDENLNLTVKVTVAITNWVTGLYEYSDAINDLQPMQKPGLINVNTGMSSSPISIASSGKLDFIQQDRGMRLFIEARDTVAASKTLVMPTGVATGVLYNWYIDAKNIYVQDSLTVTSMLTAGTIMMAEPLAESSSGFGIVATQLWVDDYIVNKVWPQIKTVNNAAAKAMQKAKAAWDRAGQALDEISLTNTKLAEVVQTTLTDAVLQWVSVGEYAGIGIKITRVSGDVVNYNWSDLQPISTTKHYHKISGTASSDGVYGRSIKVNITTGYSSGSAAEAGTLSLSGALKGIPYDLTGDSTTGQLSWKVIGGTTGNFNIADTDYFKEAVAAAQEEGYKAAIDRCKIDTSTNQVSIAAGTFAKQSTTTKTASASASAKAYDGSTSYTPYRRYDGTNVPATGTYTNSAGSSTGSFGYTGNYYKTAELTIKTSASVSWS